MNILTPLMNQRGQSPFVGGLFKGLAGGIRQADEMKRRKEMLKLQQQEFKLQEDKQKLASEELRRKIIQMDFQMQRAAREDEQGQSQREAAIKLSEQMGRPQLPQGAPSGTEVGQFAQQGLIDPREAEQLQANIGTRQTPQGHQADIFKLQAQADPAAFVKESIGQSFQPSITPFQQETLDIRRQGLDIQRQRAEKTNEPETPPTTNELAIAASGGGISPRLKRLGIDNSAKAVTALAEVRKLQQQNINIQSNQRGFQNASTLRKEFLQQSKEFTAVRNSFNRIQQSAKSPSAAGDLALIFNFMKMLDPESVVRESEFATAANAAGVPDRIRNTYNRIIRGERLATNQRADFVNRAQQLFAQQARSHMALVGQYKEKALGNGIDPQNVIVDLFTGQEPRPEGGLRGKLKFNPATGRIE